MARFGFACTISRAAESESRPESKRVRLLPPLLRWRHAEILLAAPTCSDILTDLNLLH